MGADIMTQVTSGSRTWKVAALGECMLELRGEAFGSMHQSFGGDTLNTAVYLARCGGNRVSVSYATALGRDVLSSELMARWEAEDVHTDLVLRHPSRTAGLYQIVLSASGERSFHYWRDQAAARAYFDDTTSTLEEAADDLDALYLSGISLAILPDAGRERVLALMKRLRERGGIVVFDNNYRPRLWRSNAEARAWYERAFAACSIALVTADDHQALHELPSLLDAVYSAHTLPAEEITIKRGAMSTGVGFGGSWEWVNTFEVPRVVDTTAAGDSFAAGYLYRRLEGDSPLAAAAFGNKLASRVVQFPGALIPRDAMADLMSA